MKSMPGLADAPSVHQTKGAVSRTPTGLRPRISAKWGRPGTRLEAKEVTSSAFGRSASASEGNAASDDSLELDSGALSSGGADTVWLSEPPLGDTRANNNHATPANNSSVAAKTRK